jgi:hypothetical protein
MTDYVEKFGKTFLTGATDAQSDPIAVSRVSLDSAAMGADIDWIANGGALLLTVPGGQLRVTETGLPTFVATGVNDFPSDGTSITIARVYYQPTDRNASNGLGAIKYWDITLEGQAVPPATGYISAGLIARWAADAGRIMSGPNIVTWEDTVARRIATAVGLPTVGVPPGGTCPDVVVIGANAGFTCSDLSGFPTGAAVRTVQMIWKPLAGFFFCGFGYGANIQDQAFTLGTDSAGQLAIDTSVNRTLLGVAPIGLWNTMTATYDGAVIRAWVGGVMVAQRTVALATASTIINFCRSFSGKTTTAQIGEILVYGRVLADAEIPANVIYLNSRFIGSTAVAATGTPAGFPINSTGFTAGATASAAFGFIAEAVRTSTVQMTEAEIIGGAAVLQRGIVALNGSTAWTALITGAANNTGYTANAIQYDLTGGKSVAVKSAIITTTGTALAAPVLSALNFTAPGSTTANFNITSSLAGTMDYVVYPAANAVPTADQVEAGTDGVPTAAVLFGDNVAVTASSNGFSLTNLTPGASYKITAVARNVQNLRGVIITQSFTMSAGSFTLDQQVDRLQSRLEPVGRTSTNTLKATGQLPSGAALATISGYNYVRFTAPNTTLADFDLTGLRLDYNNQANCRVEQCIIDPVVTGVSGNGNSPAIINIPPGSTNAYLGYYRMRKTAAAVGKPEGRFIAHDGTTSAAANVLIERGDMEGFSNDGVHPYGDGFIMRWCRFGLPFQTDVAVRNYMLDPTPANYNAGETVAFIEGGLWYMSLCLVNAPASAPKKAGVTGQWRASSGGAHTDFVNPRASFGAGTTVEYCFFDDDWLNKMLALTPINVQNINNIFRLVRNNGATLEYGPLTLRGNKSIRNGALPEVPYDASAGGQPNYNGPFTVVDNRIGLNGSGLSWRGATAVIGTWTNNRDTATGAQIAQP